MDQFHPIIQNWFVNRYGTPTNIQSMSWPKIGDRKHVLITAPTGSGKTLTAFLWSLNRFATGELKTGNTRVLYISPLKALNNDIQRNLLSPLKELRDAFDANGQNFPDVRVATRSGDTSSEERRQMLRKPPEILITTPESLNLLLSSAGGMSLLHDIDTLILDEIHGVVDAKRGVYLMSAVERLVRLSGEFQRIALSATINPLESVAEFVAGFRRSGDSYTPRQVDILHSQTDKQYEIAIRYPKAARDRGEDEQVWDSLAEDLLTRIHENQSTLIFVNSRALCEKLTFKINNAARETVAYAHHGSLSREIRTEVESRLKAGELSAIVATSSLEMGIDIGALDEVILVQSPGSIASTIQRIGRAGHQVGATSRCTIYPTHPQDFIESAVLARSVMERALEPIKTVNNPLDVLGQIIISMTGTEVWNLDELYHELRCSTPYHSLSRESFDLVINMLMGRYADHHIHDLKPRIRLDRDTNSVEARKGALLSLYLSGGVIPDRGYFQLRVDGSNARLGELDEEFVWEAKVGQVFSLGTQSWQVKKITHNDVLVAPAKPDGIAPPFWKAEPINRSFEYSSRIGEFLEDADKRLSEPDFENHLIEQHCTEPEAAREIISFLKEQQEHTGRPLPHRHHLLFEQIRSGPAHAAGSQMVIHTGWGAEVNRPLAMAFEAAWQNEFQEQPEVFVANESLVLQLTHSLTAAELLSMVQPEDLEKLLRIRLENSGFFGARFRENAGRALLLSKGKFNERKPLWMSRLQSQKLMDAVLKYEDFPILLETWRTCLRDEFDLDHLKGMLTEVRNREIAVSEIDSASPSPFARSIAWEQINTYMYMGDEPKSTKTSRLREDLLKQVVYTPELRAGIDHDTIQAFLASRHRVIGGYEPTDNTELLDWITERSMIPQKEWQILLDRLAFEPDSRLTRTIQAERLWVPAQDADRFQHILSNPDAEAEALETVMANWLQYYGPLTTSDISESLGIPGNSVLACLDSLCENQTLVSGQLIGDDDDEYVCDAANYEHLLRLQRSRRRPTVTARPIESLAAFMFDWQTHALPKDSLDRLFEIIDRLKLYPAAPGTWEKDILPSRLTNYRNEYLDLLFQEGGIMWIGTAEKKVQFCLESDLALLASTTADSSVIDNAYARYDFTGLLDSTGLTSSELNDQLWQEVWAGTITNDAPATLRKGLLNDFKVAEIGERTNSRRAAFKRWRGQMPWAGTWFRIRYQADELETLEQLELTKDKARLLLDRYGIVFRELCLRESDQFNWGDIFRALRLMELSGEVFPGHYFRNIPGPQYMTPASLRSFQGLDDDGPAERVFFINATDPISPSGLGLGAHGDHLPRRVDSNYLVYHGSRLTLTVGRNGKSLQFHTDPEAPDISRYLTVLQHLAHRDFEPVRRLTIESINDVPAATSPYRSVIEETFNTFHDQKSIVIQREL